MLLQDFNYFFNKAINQYINKRYNIYDVNQQTTDDLRVLKATSVLDPKKSSNSTDIYKGLLNYGAGNAKLFGGTYEVILPSDYLHILNCVCIYKLTKNWKCYNAGDYVQFAAKRLTADSWSVIVNDYYNRPLPHRPYFYIHNVNLYNTIPTNPITDENSNGTDTAAKYDVVPFNDDIGGGIDGENGKSNFKRRITLDNQNSREISTVERDTATRYGNASNVRMEIRYGSDDSVFKLEKVFIDYIKSP